MSVFDYIIEQLLEIVRLAIYRYAGRTPPAGASRKAEGVVKRETARRVEKKKARRRSAPWSNPLLWVVIIVIGGFVYRRLKQR
ncbi:MAG: hypothetical protein KA764_10495 [Anaerolineales bacterium]|nr:hypothetical protein [Anaerolineales bacterium]